MRNHIIIISLFLALIFISGCIEADIAQMDQLAAGINDNMKKGDSLYNQAANSLNKFLYDQALKQINSAQTEFNQASSSAQQGLIYARNTEKQVYIDYFQLTIKELELRINATNELEMAIPYLQGNNTTNANQHLGLANNYMQESINIQNQKQELVSQNSNLFK